MWALISFYCRAPIQAPLKDSAALDRIFCRWGIIRVSKKQVLNRQKMQQRKVNWSNYLVIASFDFLAHLVESINHVSLLYVNYHLHCTFYCHTLDIDLRFATAYLPSYSSQLGANEIEVMHYECAIAPVARENIFSLSLQSLFNVKPFANDPSFSYRWNFPFFRTMTVAIPPKGAAVPNQSVF